MKKLLSISLIFFTICANAQFLEPSIFTIGDLAPSQLNQINNIQVHIGSTFVQGIFLDVNDIESTNINGKIDVETGLNDCGGISFRITYLDYQDTENWLMLASVIEDSLHDCSNAHLMLYRDSTVYYGEMVYNSMHFKIFDLGESIIYLAEVLVTDDSCNVFASDTTEEFGLLFESFGESENECTDCEISMLICYSHSAATNHNSATRTRMLPIAKSFVAQFNEAARRSKTVDNSFAPPKIKLVGLYELPEFDEEDFLNIHPDTINSILMDSLRLNSTTGIVRSNLKADVVSVFLHNDDLRILTGSRGASGIGWNGNPGIKSNAFNYINLSGGISGFTFIHEAGHLLGADHQTISQISNVGNKAIEVKYSSCWLCGKNKKVQSIMYSITSDRVPLFSNPYLIQKGGAFGIKDERENYSYISKNKCTVSQYYTVIPGHFQIIGESYMCPSHPVRLELCYDSNLSNLGITWFTSTDGINWTAVGNSNYYIFYAPSQPNEILFVKAEMLTGSSFIGYTTKRDFHTIQTTSFVNGYPCMLKQAIENLNEFEIKIYPNPTLDFMLVESEKFKEWGVKVDLRIIDAHGRMVLHNKQRISGSSTILLDLNAIVSGNYTLQIDILNQSYSTKIVKL